jgi:hypothetical protein
VVQSPVEQVGLMISEENLQKHSKAKLPRNLPKHYLMIITCIEFNINNATLQKNKDHYKK